MGFGILEALINFIAEYFKFLYFKYFLGKNVTFKKVRNSKAQDSGLFDLLSMFFLTILLYLLTLLKC
jgi:hypothetical protein